MARNEEIVSSVSGESLNKNGLQENNGTSTIMNTSTIQNQPLLVRRYKVNVKKTSQDSFQPRLKTAANLRRMLSEFSATTPLASGGMIQNNREKST